MNGEIGVVRIGRIDYLGRGRKGGWEIHTV